MTDIQHRTMQLWLHSMVQSIPISITGLLIGSKKGYERAIGVVQSIAREDGSGLRFNVTLHTGVVVYKSFCK